VSDKPFVPEFGPNGAVMNAPGMTEEMRRHLIGPLPLSPRKLARDIALIVFWGVIVIVIVGTGLPARVFQALEPGGDPWLAGWVSGAITMVALFTVVKVTGGNMRRWEIAVQADQRRLDLPLLMRWSLFLADSVGYAALVGGWSVNLILRGREYYFLVLTGFLTALGMVILRSLLIWLANRKGWTWRQAPSA
jgi:hypothetical protein